MPARRKFMKAPATELSHICDVIQRMALAYPHVHFRLHHDARTVADYVAVAQPRHRLAQIFGADMAKELVFFQSAQGDLAVHGFASVAPGAYPNARYLFTFVNRRYVRDKVITHAITLGYETLLMRGQYPAVVLFLDLPFSEVDVNVHPAKIEVRFRRQGDVHGAVTRAVRQALQREAKEPSSKGWPMPFASSPRLGEAPLPYGAVPLCRSGESAPFSPARAEILPAEPGHAGFFSSMRVLGQILGCYLVCATAEGLALIDQHAAHERVAFEKLRRQLAAGAVESQNLLIPQTIELSAGEMMLMEQNLTVMERFGFRLEPFGPGSYAITAVPALLPPGDHTSSVRQMVAELAEVDASVTLRQRLEERLATIACHSVIRANRMLESDEIRALLADLDQVEFATQCPHGRPVLLEFGRQDLEKLFRRVV
jgi:DNA mismatch repair protein MutL